MAKKNAVIEMPESIGNVIFNIPAKTWRQSPYVYQAATVAASSKADPDTGVGSFSVTTIPGGTSVVLYSTVVAIAIQNMLSLNGGGLGGHSYFTHNEATTAKWKALNEGLAEAEAERLKESEQLMIRALSALTEINTPKKAGKVATK